MVNEAPEEPRLTGREWLAAMAELERRIRVVGSNLPPALQRDIAEALVADELIVISKLQQLASEHRAERRLASMSLSISGSVPGCTEPACSTIDIHDHGPACGELCATCRGDAQ